MARIGIVVSEFNYDITYLMLQKALSHAKFLGLEVTYVFKVPGTYEIPFAVASLLKRNDVDGVVALGAVIKGATKHDELVAGQTARKLMDLMIQYGKPVGLGIIGPGATRMQALERVEDYARRAVEAVAKMINRSRSLEEKKFTSETVFIE
ncbi:6,7-dimethyl-8-ribityllumazine synthase [Staphylothermus hellenicus]|uniref:6,7-dimethyl-8-ribityllumazine synthase n=1 Tax=Staphylothermus hellenicus (strain DSM 12710 / JCM 10830 / BK20S6-10-b1 / P8) TaxID=591019 RepID=D7DBA1_STAHD|nr:6,7-dimethyl-8-ribityllumazine synthase [Staphylothermus hellenicus]ADI31448.1 6,7-dimethyl-8-ribityllumazine synthase [Staphylothermus hellenicus DSM 12710]